MLNRRAASPGSEEHRRHVECTDQDLGDDDDRRFASCPLLNESCDEPRDEEHTGADDEPVTPRLAPILPLGDECLRLERGQDAQSRRALELDQDRRERGERDPRAGPHACRPPAREPHLLERSLAEASEPAVKRAPVERREPLRDQAQAGNTTQVDPDRALDDGEGIDLPRLQIGRQDAWSVATLAPRDRDLAFLDRLLQRTVLEEYRDSTHPPRREHEAPEYAALWANHRAQEKCDPRPRPRGVGEERVMDERHADREGAASTIHLRRRTVVG